MRTVNPTDGMKHCPVKLICNCIFKACLIMHLHKAAKLKSCWQLSSVTSVFSYCSFGRRWQGGVQISMCINQLSKFTCVKKISLQRGKISFMTSTEKFIILTHFQCRQGKTATTLNTRSSWKGWCRDKAMMKESLSSNRQITQSERNLGHTVWGEKPWGVGRAQERGAEASWEGPGEKVHQVQ